MQYAQIADCGQIYSREYPEFCVNSGYSHFYTIYCSASAGLGPCHFVMLSYSAFRWVFRTAPFSIFKFTQNWGWSLSSYLIVNFKLYFPL